MKHLLFTTFALLFVVCLFNACTSSKPLPDLALTPTVDSTLILLPNNSIQLNANIPVTWRTSGGTVSSSGLYTSPMQEGVYTVTVINSADTLKKLTLKVAVSKHADAFKEMRKTGLVVFFRHTEANVGSDALGTGADWWKTCDQTKMRQLSTKGRQDAVSIGNAFKNLQLPVEKVISSEFCRALQTAELMALGTPTTTPDLTYYPFDSPREAQRYANTMKVIGSTVPAKGKNIVLSAHVLTSVPTGITSPLSSVQQGDGALFRVSSVGNSVFVKTIPIADWLALK